MQIPVLVGMITMLLGNQTVTARQLSEKYEMSLRNVYRYIDALNEAGIPIEAKTGFGGGYKIVEQYKLKSIYFDKDEYERLLFCLASFSNQDKLTRTLSDKIMGLNRAIGEAYILKTNQLIVDTTVGEQLQSTIDQLRLALFGNRLVDIEYHAVDGKITNRIIEPYSLILKNGTWYIYCYCCLRHEFRFFKISRIARMLVHKQNFLPRMFEVDTQKIDAEILRGKDMVEVVLHCNAKALTAVEEWLGIENVTKDNGSFVARAVVPYDELLIGKILSYGSLVTVERPARLKADIVKRCEEIVRNATKYN